MIVWLVGVAVWFAGLLTLDTAPRYSRREFWSAIVVLALPLAALVWLILDQIP